MKVKLLRFTQFPDETCALAAGLCYSSNAETVDKIYDEIKDKTKRLLDEVISSGHDSVLEHSFFTFGISGVSRALLLQFTRHRIASFTVQSQRRGKFIKEFEFIVPDTIKRASPLLLKKYNDLLKNTELLYKEFLKAGIPPEDARYILPNASPIKLIVTMNARELRHFFLLRCCNRAQKEIRNLAYRMLKLVKKEAPLLFANAGPRCIREGCREAHPCGKGNRGKI
jgi:thymidylate synthase (FAD)